MLNKADGGMLGIRLKNKRYAEKKNAKTNVSIGATRESDVICESVESDLENFEKLKSMLISESNLSSFNILLKQTLPHRMKLLQEMTEHWDEKQNLRELFPYFFTFPQSVKFQITFNM